MSEKTYPATWRIASDFDPNDHMMNLKGKAYLNVQNRLLWFIRDQRDFIVRGLGLYSYIVRTELVEQDLERGFAQFKTYVRDVLGNEATMYGSETAKDFGDYAEKASTKSLGRALWALGYGTGMAPEMDEGERVVDSPIAPVERKASAFVSAPKPLRPAPQVITPDMDVVAVAAAMTVEETVDPIANQRASVQQQQHLGKALREAGHDNQAKVSRFLTAVLKRQINVAALAECDSDITIAEVAKVHQTLTAVNAHGARA